MFQRPFIIGKFSSNSSSVQDTYPHLIRGETEAFYFLNINLLFFFFPNLNLVQVSPIIFQRQNSLALPK